MYLLAYERTLGNYNNTYLGRNAVNLLAMTVYAVSFILHFWPCSCHEANNPKERMPRSGIIAPSSRWPNKTVFYKFDSNLSDYYSETLIQAQTHIKGRTCIRFKEWKNESDGPDYIYVFQDPQDDRCYADVGRNGSHSNFSLGVSCWSNRIHIHELVHTIGFFHVHERTDRDRFVTINIENVVEGRLDEFTLLNDSYVATFGVPYDYDSIMHYTRTLFSVSRSKETITPMDPDAIIGETQGLSHFDIRGINNMYCSGTVGIRFQNVANKQYLQVANAEGSLRPIVTSNWTGSGSDAQKWTVQWYSMRNQTKCSSVVPWSQYDSYVAGITANPTSDIVGVQEDVNSTYQKWRVERIKFTKDSTWRIVSCSTGKCILANGTSQVVQAPCNSSGTRHIWKIYSVFD